MEAQKGMKVKVKESQLSILKELGYSAETEYPIISTNHFWNSIRITNDDGKDHSFDVDRFELIKTP